ncbi:MAG: hypothetical protein E7611_07475 [Ruminococcaceae bacterium]|nr:hypothetical protein [Oscillospiraceae bacterium]
MMSNKIIMPTKEEVKILLSLMIENKFIYEQTVGELLGLKWVDSLMPKIKDEQEWGYEGLNQFFIDNDIAPTCTLKEALDKLNKN